MAKAHPYAAGFTLYEAGEGALRSELHLWSETDFARVPDPAVVGPLVAG